jgi:hypothetical protein
MRRYVIAQHVATLPPEGKDKARCYRDSASADPNRDLSIANALLMEAIDPDSASALRLQADPDPRGNVHDVAPPAR